MQKVWRRMPISGPIIQAEALLSRQWTGAWHTCVFYDEALWWGPAGRWLVEGVLKDTPMADSCRRKATEFCEAIILQLEIN